MASMVQAWMVVVIIGREFIVSGLRSVLATQGIAMPASSWGKSKTVAQAVAIVLLILTNSLERMAGWGQVGVWALWVAVVLALVSAAEYVLRFFRNFSLDDEKSA